MHNRNSVLAWGHTHFHDLFLALDHVALQGHMLGQSCIIAQGQGLADVQGQGLEDVQGQGLADVQGLANIQGQGHAPDYI